jgi:urease alpha subunit
MLTWQAHSGAVTSLAFVSQHSLDHGVTPRYGLSKRLSAVRDCRHIGKRDMKLNDAMPRITVDPETYVVTADGEVLRSAPAHVLPLAQRYFLFSRGYAMGTNSSSASLEGSVQLPALRAGVRA